MCIITITETIIGVQRMNNWHYQNISEMIIENIHISEEN